MSERLRILLIANSDAGFCELFTKLSEEGFEAAVETVRDLRFPEVATSGRKWDVMFCEYVPSRLLRTFDFISKLKDTGVEVPLLIYGKSLSEDEALKLETKGAASYFVEGCWSGLGSTIRREMNRVRETKKLQTMLNTVRNVHRAVIRREDPIVVAETVCREWAAAGALRAAWVYLHRRDGSTRRSFAFGWNTSLDAFFDRMERGQLPPCCQRAMSDGEVICTTRPFSTCLDCLLFGQCADKESEPEETMTAAIRLNDTLFGYICVSKTASSDSEASFLKGLADDLAFAFKELEAARIHAQTEEALKKEALRRRLLMGVSRDGICIFNQQHEIVEANLRFAEMLGYTPKELLSLHTWDFESTMSEAEIRASFQDLTQTNVLFETRHRRKDGTVYDAEVSASGTLVEDEPMVFTVSRDITEKRRLQAKLAQSARMAGMGVLAAGVAHEINNPLAYVLYTLEGLKEDSELGPLFAPADAASRLEEALSGIKRIQQITRALRTFSKVDEDVLAPVDVHYTIDCACNMASNEIKYRARLVKEFGDIPVIAASEGRLSQVFLNLLMNSAHSIVEGDVDKNRICIRTRLENKTVCVEIEDTGKGIPVENLPRIFEPFFSTKPGSAGMGLGLSISKNIIENLKGTIEVISEVGRGTCFVVRLPVGAPNFAAVSKESRPPQMEPEVSGRILLIDDEEGLCRAVKRVLRKHDVICATHAEEAKHILETDRTFDVILCDMMMPGMSGADLHRWIAEHFPLVAERVVFITGGAFTPATEEYLKTTGSLCLEKPFNSFQFRKLISDLVLDHRTENGEPSVDHNP